MSSLRRTHRDRETPLMTPPPVGVSSSSAAPAAASLSLLVLKRIGEISNEINNDTSTFPPRTLTTIKQYMRDDSNAKNFTQCVKEFQSHLNHIFDELCPYELVSTEDVVVQVKAGGECKYMDTILSILNFFPRTGIHRIGWKNLNEWTTVFLSFLETTVKDGPVGKTNDTFKSLKNDFLMLTKKTDLWNWVCFKRFDMKSFEDDPEIDVILRDDYRSTEKISESFFEYMDDMYDW